MIFQCLSAELKSVFIFEELRYYTVMPEVPFYLKNMTHKQNVVASFVTRVPGVVVDNDRALTVARLKPSHQQVVKELGFTWNQLHLAEQVHGGDIQVVEIGSEAKVWQNVDGLITADRDILLGIYVADCGAVYMSDPVKNVIALLHSGKKGTEADITGKAIRMMKERYGSDPRDILVALAPCVRPPVYEIDFAQDIYQQALTAGVRKENFQDSKICTSSDLKRYYSYRVEQGCTGRMLALLGQKG